MEDGFTGIHYGLLVLAGQMHDIHQSQLRQFFQQEQVQQLLDDQTSLEAVGEQIIELLPDFLDIGDTLLLQHQI